MKKKNISTKIENKFIEKFKLRKMYQKKIITSSIGLVIFLIFMIIHNDKEVYISIGTLSALLLANIINSLKQLHNLKK